MVTFALVVGLSSRLSSSRLLVVDFLSSRLLVVDFLHAVFRTASCSSGTEMLSYYLETLPMDLEFYLCNLWKSHFIVFI